MMHRTIYVFLGIFIIGVIGWGVWSTTAEKTSEPVERIPLRLGLAMQPMAGLVIVALENGYFDEEGLDVKVLEYPSGKRALREGLLEGAVDITSSADVPIVFAALEKKEFRILATMFTADNVNRVIARKSSGIDKADDLKGKRIATQRASAVHYFLHLFLLEQGLSETDVDLSYLKAEALPPALHSGAIDAFSMREPYISQAKRLLGNDAVVFSDPGIYMQVEPLLVSEEFLMSEPEAVQRFLRAVVRAESYVKRHFDEAAALVANRLQANVGQIREMFGSYRMWVGLDQSLIMLLENEARWVIGANLCDCKEVPDFTRYIDSRPLEAVSPDTVTLVR